MKGKVTIKTWKIKAVLSPIHKHFMTKKLFHQYPFAKKLHTPDCEHRQVPRYLVRKKQFTKCWWNWLLYSISPTFLSSFCANILLPHNYKTKLAVSKEKLLKLFCKKKAVRQMLVKLTTGIKISESQKWCFLPR